MLLDPRAVGWWRARCVVVATAPTVGLVVLGVLVEPLLLVAAAVCAAAGTAVAATLPRRWYELHRWEVDDVAVYTRSGYLRTSWRLAPLSVVRAVDTRTGPLQRAFGLATLVLTTASAAGAITVAGLAADLAADVARRLSDRTAGVRSGLS
jgi:hypothetical protein